MRHQKTFLTMSTLHQWFMSYRRNHAKKPIFYGA